MAESTTIHEEWKRSKAQRSADNIALLKLPRMSKYPVPKLLTDHFQLNTGQKLMAVGYGPSGNTPTLGQDIFGALKMEPQEYLDRQQCNRAALWNGSILSNLACALNEERRASCIGVFPIPQTAPDVNWHRLTYVDVFMPLNAFLWWLQMMMKQ